MQSWSGKAIVRETPRQPVTLQLVKKSRPQNSEAKRKTTSGPYTRDVHRFPPGRGGLRIKIGRPTQDAALELLVVGVIFAMMLILSLRKENAVRDTRAGASA